MLGVAHPGTEAAAPRLLRRAATTLAALARTELTVVVGVALVLVQVGYRTWMLWSSYFFADDYRNTRLDDSGFLTRDSFERTA